MKNPSSVCSKLAKPLQYSLKSFGIKYHQIDLINNDFNYDEIKNFITKNKVKLIEIQRSKGYSTRKSITIIAKWQTSQRKKKF